MNGKQIAVLLAIIGAATVLFTQYETIQVSEFESCENTATDIELLNNVLSKLYNSSIISTILTCIVYQDFTETLTLLY